MNTWHVILSNYFLLLSLYIFKSLTLERVSQLPGTKRLPFIAFQSKLISFSSLTEINMRKSNNLL